MDGLDLSLPNRQPPPWRPSRLLYVLAVLVLVAVLVDTAAVVRMSLRHPAGLAADGATGLSPQQQKQLALQLEQQGLRTAAVAAWKDYLGVAELAGEEEARIWYRIGTLQEDVPDYEAALVSYYRSERIAPVAALQAEIARRTQDCLESLGKFAALRYELRDRVDLQADSTGAVVMAEIGPQRITRADLDRHLETLIQRQLASMAYLSKEEQLRQQKALFKQYSTPEARQQLLNQFVVEELLYRRARQSGLADDPQVRALLHDQDRALLAEQVMRREVTDRVQVTPEELQAYYQAHPQEFTSTDAAAKGPRPFDQVRGEVLAKVRAQREQQLQQELLTQLRDEYDVVIHQRALAPPATASQAAPTSAAMTSGTATSGGTAGGGVQPGASAVIPGRAGQARGTTRSE